MKQKEKNIWKVFVVFAMVCVTVFTNPLKADAKEKEVSDSIGAVSGLSSFSAKGSEISTELKTGLETIDVCVDDKTLVEVVPLVSDSDKQVLVVTNVQGNRVTKDTILQVDSDGEVQSVMPRAGGTISYPYGDEGYSIRATAVYNEYSYGGEKYCQPVGVYFFYYDEIGANLTYINVEYVSVGTKFSYPGYTDLNEDVYNVISKSQSSPATNTMYSKTQEYPSNCVINCKNGTLNVGQYFHFTYIMNGSEHTATSKFY